TPQTLRDINQLVVQAAVQLGLEDGKTLRVDTTVVESNIHYPTDATLLWDAVRTITRLIADLHEKLPDGVQGFTNRTRSARRRMQAIQRMSAAERTHQQEPKYRELIRITEQVVTNARQVVEKAKAAAAGAGDLIASLDRKSTRLNSSHVASSYAVFCLKKKRETRVERPGRGAESRAELELGV